LKGLNISEEFGVILLGLAAYDVVNGSWLLPAHVDWTSGGWLVLLRAMVTFVVLVLLVASLAITHRTNSMVAGVGLIESGERSRKLMGKRPFLYAAATVMIASVLIFALIGLGPRQAFLIWVGVGFVNLGPWVEKWVVRI
jgi:hypothetical protein